MKSKHIYKALIIINLILINSLNIKAQLSPLRAQYFQNPYFVNPAMAGANGNIVFASYANQWNKISGSPVLLALSASGMINNKAAIGLNLFSDKAGLLERTQALGTFAYKVELDAENSIRFGVSFSWTEDYLNQSGATNNGTTDPALGRFNEKMNYLDGNFGFAYVGKKLTTQFSYLSLNQKRQNQLSTVDYSTFFSSVGYQFDLDKSSRMNVKPLIAYRGIKGYNDQIEFAAEWGIDELSFFSMYSSNKTFSGGVGFKNLKKLSLSAIYSTEPQGLQGITGGRFDLTIGYHL